MIYLINYDRLTGALVSIEEYKEGERTKASSAKLELEISLLTKPGSNEVVLLEAGSKEMLKQTHRRYFESFDEMKSKR